MLTFKDGVYVRTVLEDKLSKTVLTSAPSLKISFLRWCLPQHRLWKLLTFKDSVFGSVVESFMFRRHDGPKPSLYPIFDRLRKAFFVVVTLNDQWISYWNCKLQCHFLFPSDLIFFFFTIFLKHNNPSYNHH